MRTTAMVLVALAGCVDLPDEFKCEADAACVLDGKAGRCEPSGYCSFADASCGADGYRYHELAGAHVGTCIVSGTTPNAIEAVDFAKQLDSTKTSCGRDGARDAYFEMNSPLPQVLFVDTGNGTDVTASVAIRAGACPGTTELACETSVVPYTAVAASLDASTYCIVVEGEPTTSASTVGLRVVPARRMGMPLELAQSGSTCATNAFVFGVGPTGGHVDVTVSPVDVDIVLSLHLLVPDGPLLQRVDASSGAETLHADLTMPGAYWLVVDGAACGQFSISK